MFEIPQGVESLMAEYKELIINGLKLKYNILKEDEVEELLFKEFFEIDEDFIKEMDVSFELESYFDEDEWVEFINSRIGEDFVVLESFEDYAFCIHEVDDFTTEIEKLQKKIKKKENNEPLKKELDDYKVAA